MWLLNESIRLEDMMFESKDVSRKGSFRLRSAIFMVVFSCCFVWLSLGWFEQRYIIVAAKITNLIVGNGYKLIEFRKDGIPVTYVARLRKRVVSPFYVVFAGLIYSRSALPEHTDTNSVLWEVDRSKDLWPIQPPPNLRSVRNFRIASDWVLDKIRKVNGKWHVEYDFLWPYAGVKGGYLLPPWYSGLTDAQAIILLLRAYDVFKNRKYLVAARRLYDSTITPVGLGGSLLHCEGKGKWIVEYVVKEGKYPRVLNGMIYATLGIRTYEIYENISDPIWPVLIRTIKRSLKSYDLGYYTSYDQMGTLAKIKYHRIQTFLLWKLYEITGDKVFLCYFNKWKRYKTHFLFKYFYYHRPTVNSIIVVSLAFGLGMVLSALMICGYKFFREK